MSASAQTTPSAGPTAPGTSHSRAACRPKRRQAHTCVTAHDRLPRPHASPRVTMGLAPHARGTQGALSWAQCTSRARLWRSQPSSPGRQPHVRRPLPLQTLPSAV